MNSNSLSSALVYLQSVICQRFEKIAETVDNEILPVEILPDDASPFANFMRRYQFNSSESIILLLAIAPHLQPDFFNQIINRYLPDGGDLPEFGGVKGNNHRGILPTGETAQFIIAGNNLMSRLEVQKLFSGEHLFFKKHILWLDEVQHGEPLMSGKLIIDPEIVELLTTGVVSKPRFSINFPAEHVETEMEWDDLVLHPKTFQQIKEMEHWITYNDTLLHEWGYEKKD